MKKRVVFPIILVAVICCAAVFSAVGCADNRAVEFVERTLNNAAATPNTRRLFDYMNRSYGEKILSGQNVSSNIGNEIEEIVKVTGKYPAIASFDAMGLSSLNDRYNSPQRDRLLQEVLDWAKSGGIVAMQWHWYSPSGALDTKEQPWYKSFYTKATDFDVQKVLDPSSKEYAEMLTDIDRVAEVLSVLLSYDIPVLWRPLHEAAGGWFWWGAKGAQSYRALWQLLYERLTDYHKLNNLIWVWNGQHKDWYVGDDRADMVSFDAYGSSTAAFERESSRQFVSLRRATKDRKIVALSECGTVPSLKDFEKKNICWSYFAIWCYEFVVEDGAYSEAYTSKERLIATYDSPLVVTRDELPFALYSPPTVSQDC